MRSSTRVDDDPHRTRRRVKIAPPGKHETLRIEVSREVVQKNRDQPAASYTKLGWVLHGRENGIARPVHVINYIAREPSAEDEIEKKFKKNKIFYNEYKLQIANLLEKRYAEPAPEARVTSNMVKIREEDRDSLRFLWRENENEEPKEFRMNSLIFGACPHHAPRYTNEPDALVATESLRREQKALYRRSYRTYARSHLEDENDTLSFSLNLRNCPRSNKDIVRQLNAKSLAP
ncbi:hypothetical protein EVAR_98945_1 [Eumeta japonica]|uniref:Uncharacterized protein n=1 Tax=Eumeta variegata TaxID=151549 RepID=A0A4C1SQZ9_EUMVA|nr:hypothetical protein EVAR_98945_1 [Eumeta japonica]